MKKAIEVILFVEDEENLRTLIEAFLSSCGFRVLSACDGQEGLSLVKNRGLNDIDLILADVVMPKMSGKQMVDLLKPTLPQAKVLFMSGYTEDQLAPHGVLEPGVEIITKPFLAKNLVKRIRELD
jgi:DNA-binding response OmpR family regulator